MSEDVAFAPLAAGQDTSVPRRPLRRKGPHAFRKHPVPGRPFARKSTLCMNRIARGGMSRMAGLLARGSSPACRTAFPALRRASGVFIMAGALAAHSCGGSRGFSPRSLFTRSACCRFRAPSAWEEPNPCATRVNAHLARRDKIVIGQGRDDEVRGRGGTGRRNGLKIRWPSGRVGSSPTARTISRQRAVSPATPPPGTRSSARSRA